MLLRISKVSPVVLLCALLGNCGQSGSEDRDALRVGIAVCDQFIADHAACIASKVPEADRAAMSAELSGKARAWQRLAADEATRAGMADLCIAERRNAELSLGKLGCPVGAR